MVVYLPRDEAKGITRMDLYVLNIPQSHSSSSIGHPTVGGRTYRVRGVELVITKLIQVGALGREEAAARVLIALRNSLLIFIRFSKQVIFHGH